MRYKNVSVKWSKGDKAEFLIRDTSRKITYKSKFNVRDSNKIAEMLMALEKYGSDTDKVIKIMDRNKKIDWFS